MPTLVSIQQGGTGANSAAEAINALGVVANTGGLITGNLNVAATLITQNVIPDANITYDLGSITTNGTNTTYGTSSDQRLKENIVSAPDSGDDVDAINVVSYKWKSNGSETKYGLIAQELISVAPDAVQQGDDGEEVERTWGVDYSKLVPMLVKEIQSLRARVAALESN